MGEKEVEGTIVDIYSYFFNLKKKRFRGLNIFFGVGGLQGLNKVEEKRDCLERITEKDEVRVALWCCACDTAPWMD